MPIDKHNWRLMNKYLEYRGNVDQISAGSVLAEKTHMRYILEWAHDVSFRKASEIRPTLPDYLQANPLNEKQGKLSPAYIKKVLATARLFFTWLHENEPKYKHIKPAWIKTIKAKRLTDIPQVIEYVTLEEVQAIAARPARTARARRARAALVFLFLSGMRIGAFVSLPIQAVDIRQRVIYQYPSLGVKTKNSKHGITYLLDIPELLKVVQEWDDEIRAMLPPHGFWYAPISPYSGELDTSIVEIGNHRKNLARRDFKMWLKAENLLYHSPHKFRHGHIRYLAANARNVADLKAISQNVMHSDMKITDKFYTALNGDDLKDRISALNQNGKAKDKQKIKDFLLELLNDLDD